MLKIQNLHISSCAWRSLGILVVVTVAAMLICAKAAMAQTYTVLHTFAGVDGASPNAGLVVDLSGNLYGTTVSGGASDQGTVFQIDSSGTYSVLHSFDGSDGSDPRVGLLIGPSGTVSGTAWIGGALGAGNVFALNPSQGLQPIYSFTGGSDGAHPNSSLIRDSEGNFYGATWDGGNETSCHSCGVVYKLDRTGEETVLHTFNGGTDGANMVAGVVRDAQGNLYGTTYQGGTGHCSYQAGGCGIIFKLDTSNNETILYTFEGGADGAAPFGGMVQDAAGNFYGTASFAGSELCSSGCGVVFKVDSLGNFSVFHSFDGPNGWDPNGDLIIDRQGNIYGATALGGAYNSGVVYRLSATGEETLLYSFTGGADGAIPGQVRLLLYKGSLYGTTSAGGESGLGVVFKLTP